MKLNPKKSNSARRKRPKYKEDEILKAVWDDKRKKMIFPPNPRGQNRAERRKEQALNRKKI